MSYIAMAPVRFPIPIAGAYRTLFAVVGMRPAACYVDVDEDALEVRMGWAFHARVERASIRRAAPDRRRRLSRGVHGFAGRWLVNGSGDGIVALDLAPAQRARVLGVPVRLRQLLVNVDDPGRFVAAVRAS